jgi:signal transduction histidine kinase
MMRLKPMSLQNRLLLGILISLTLTLALGGVIVYRMVNAELRREFDAGLLDKLRFYETTVSLGTVKGVSGFPKYRMGAAEWERETNPLKPSPEFVQFWFLPKGRQFHHSAGPDPQLPLLPGEIGIPTFSDFLLYGKTPVRIATSRIYPEQDTKGDPFAIQVALARPTESLCAALDQVKWFLVKSACLTTMVLMLATRWIIRRGVKPVASLSQQIEVMPLVDSNERFALPGAPSELQPVVGRLNALMDRVGAAIEHERMFTSNAAHELRNPLAAIRSQVELALNRTRSVEEYEETLEGILESQTGMQRVVDHLLLLARLESGHQLSEFSREPTSLSKLLRKAWRHGFERASGRKLKVTWQITDTPEEICLPVALIEIVLRNLFDNAVAYTPVAGNVIISATTSDGEARITVSNTNPGLEPAQLENTFAPFWRGDPNASGHRGNAGIGLALVRRIMETMHGTAQAAIEEGMITYSITFPIGEEAARASAE